MKRVKLSSGKTSESTAVDGKVGEMGSNEELRRKSVALPSSSKALQRQPVENVRSSSLVAVNAKRKSCPAIGVGASGMASSIAGFLTADRLLKIFGGTDEALSDAEKSREIRRVTLCLSSLSKAQGQTDFISKSSFESILRTIQSHVDCLDDENWNIAHHAIQYAMLPRNCGSFYSTLENLINEIIVHRSHYANSIIQLLMMRLTRSNAPPGSNPEGDDPGPSIAELKCFDTSIKLISKIVDVIGLKRLNRSLINMMTASYPYVLRPPLSHYYYVRNLVSLNRMTGNSMAYCVLSVLFHKLTRLDSLLPRVVLESEQLENLVLPKQEKNGSSTSSSYIIPFDDADELVDEVIKSYKKIEEDMEQSKQIATLDTCLSYVISFLSGSHETINFNSLLAIFETEILPIFNTNCVQFAFFHLINLKEEYLNAFLDFLWKKFVNVSTSPVLRILSMGYIAGVLTRSTKVDRRTLKRWISRLSNFAHEYLNTRSDSANYNWANVNVIAHGSFYAVCQAIFYIFAFRHFELVYGNVPCLKEEGGKAGDKPNFQGLPPPSSSSSFMYALNLQRLITCDLNPLKACIPSITKTFVNIAQVYQISYCKTVLERNNRANIKNMISESMRDGVGEHVNLLNDSFFPFDPLLLPYCKMIVEDTFRPYDGNSLALTLIGESVKNAISLSIKPDQDGGIVDDDDNCDDFDMEGNGNEDAVDGGNMLLVCE